ncbi:hypothetical protein EC396_04140 [Lutibacter sp. HS1-25]|uniref:hypothetical protein n=1 Tax=Lutibacter sp. HS1-25 TaxID=2485000 RepID=UPI001012C39D|nr:hypothetical protein [Lutibacter sp. HS1-25]RXP61391.1 hypothetical protein EC396_04140 [Lutibacter sp. HS1-25]
MKKIVYLLMVFTLVFTTACDPMEDIYDDLDSSPTKENDIIGNLEYTFTDEDYTTDIEDGGYFGFSYPNFSSTEQAKELIPDFLTGEYPVWGVTYEEDGKIKEASTAKMTFNIYAPKKTEKSLVIYTVTTADYDANPETEKYNNFDDMSQIYDFLDLKYPNPADRVLVSLTYKFFSGGVKTLNNGFLYINGEWEMVNGFTDDEYKTMGESYPNFSNEDEAEAKIPVFLLDKYKYTPKKAGDIESTMYKIYVGGGVTESYIMYFIFDGSTWSKYEGVIQETIQFGHNGKTWVPDNTIKHTLTSDDVAFISNALMDKYPGPADNVGYFGSFDRRSSSSNYWNDEMLLEAFNLLLDNKNPSAEEGQKYTLTYIIYNGATTNETKNVIKTSGVWVYQ